jgi:hypothetical protein
MKTFKILNRFVQEIIKHLLTLDSKKSKINLTLIRELFGEMATLKYYDCGKYKAFQNEKIIFLNFIKSHLLVVDSVNIQKKENKKIDYESLNLLSENKNYSNISKTFGALIDLDVIYTNNIQIKESTKCDTECDVNFCLQDSNVDMKYLRHLDWLKYNFGPHSIQAKSFKNLLHDAYIKYQK